MYAWISLRVLSFDFFGLPLSAPFHVGMKGGKQCITD